LAVGYFATVAVIVGFSWFFGDHLLEAPEFFPDYDPRIHYTLAKIAAERVHGILAGAPNSWTLSGWGFAHQYNGLFGLALVPAFTAFGESWYIYGMGVAVIYGTAASLAVAAITVVLLRGHRPAVVLLTFATTACVAATRSAGWYSTIFYYPDIGNAFVLAVWLIGALLLLRRPTWQRTGVLVVLTVGVLQFRRANLFAWGDVGIGLAVSAAIECWVDWRKSDLREKRTRLRAGALRIGHLAASAIIAISILAIPPRSPLREMLSITGENAYVEFAQRPIEIIAMMQRVMGIIPIALSAAGYIAGAIVFRRRRFEIIGLGLGAILNVITWVMVLRFVAPSNYVVPGVLFLPLGIGLGMGALAEELRGRRLVAALGTAFLLLFLSAARLLDGVLSNTMDLGFQTSNITDLSSPRFLQARLAKVSFHRGWEGPLKEVFARMGIEGPQPRKVLVLTSFDFNECTVQSAAEALLGNMAKSYFFHSVPVLDFKSKLLVTEISDADYVLVPAQGLRGDWLQTPSGPSGKGMRAVRDMFLNNHGVALDFERLGEPVDFPGVSVGSVAFPGFSVSIYRRLRESDERTALATIEALEAVVTARGYEQPSWIEIGRPSRSEPVDAPRDAVKTDSRTAGDGWPARYVSYDKVPAGAVELTGDGQTTCPQGVLLTLRPITRSDAETGAVGTTLLTHSVAPQPFSLATAVAVSGLHLELEINPPLSEAACDVSLDRLQLRSTRSGS
jgi:hypothetical protein